MLYFAYGSDLNWQALLDWGKANGQFIPPRSDPHPAVLANHRLCFPVYDAFWHGGVADVVPETGKSVSGALYEVNEVTLNILDRIAGRCSDRHGREAGHRQRSTIKVNLYHGGRSMDAFVYRLRKPEHVHVPPTERYLERLAEAAWKLGLSAMWIMHLRSFATRLPEPPAAADVLRTAIIRLAEIGVDQHWPKLRRPHATIQANGIRPACDRAVGTAATKRLRAV
jgi:gamma-glutamylcyclotransferase (GGCT)/AIG2-like uncharacterized protein YtfP